MKKIWQKQESSNIDLLIEKYTVGSDFILDMQLITYDIQASEAHTQMLCKIGVLSQEEKEVLIGGLKKLSKKIEDNDFSIDISQEDSHTAIETYLIETCGDVGKKIHTGRSRNDQILVTMRLYTLDKIEEIETLVWSLIKSFEKKTKEVGEVKMPGYTHTQRAMPTTVGTWLGSFSDAMKDNLILLEAAKKVNNQNPLGSAAGFGETVFGLDRELTTQLLGFERVQKNPMYCGYSRGKFEYIVLQNLSQVMLDLGKMANDLVYFSAKEFNFFTLPDGFKTGSSIMPQKKNWDIMELVRGNTNLFLGYEFQIREIYKMLLSGYNRDFQLTKEPYLKSINILKSSIEVCTLVIDHLGVNTGKLEGACTQELYATEEAYKLVKKGMSFRDAYKQVGQKYI